MDFRYTNYLMMEDVMFKDQKYYILDEEKIEE